MILNATDDKKRPVYWWFMYKVAGKSTTDDGHKVTETNYSYFAVNIPQDGKLALSANHVDKGGALPNLLTQLCITWLETVAQRRQDRGTVAFQPGFLEGRLAVTLQSVSRFPKVVSITKVKEDTRKLYNKDSDQLLVKTVRHSTFVGFFN